MAEDERVREATTSWGLFALEHGLVEVVPDLSGGEAADKTQLTLSGAMMLASLSRCLPEEMPRSQRNVVNVATTNAVKFILDRCEKDGTPIKPRPPACVRQDKPSNIIIAPG